MKADVKSVSKGELDNIAYPDSDIVIVFASRDTLEDEATINSISTGSKSDVVFVSTAGQIASEGVSDETITISSLQLERSSLRSVCFNVKDFNSYSQVGAHLYDSLNEPGLRGIIVFSDGTSVNGSDLKNGLEQQNKGRIPIAGGLSGDGSNFEKTYTGINGIAEGNVVGIGLYGEHIHIGYGSRGGWQYQQQMNIISESDGNVLKEINGEPALEFYKKKLNGKLQELPSDALKYPLMVSDVYSNQQLVRTVLSVDEDTQTMTFAGDMPLASGLQFLSATDEELIQGAQSAALVTKATMGDHKSEIAFLISCVGRKLVLGDRISDEVKAVHDIIGTEAQIAGFYSYGELSPSEVSGECELLNQTMTIITLAEDMD